MIFQWNIFLAALGLAMVLEGLPYLMAPEGVRRLAELLRGTSSPFLRGLGLASIAAGLALVALARFIGAR